VDVPADVESVLLQLVREARGAFESGDGETGVAAITSAATVASNKLPESTLREQVVHGCDRTEAVAEDGDLLVAAEYAASIERLLEETAGE
jgi:hypothetical protein